MSPASETLRYYRGDCCRELTSAHNQRPDCNRKLLISERKSLTTKLRPLNKLRKFDSKNLNLDEISLTKLIFYGHSKCESKANKNILLVSINVILSLSIKRSEG